MKYFMLFLFALAVMVVGVSAQTNAVPEIDTAVTDFVSTWGVVKVALIPIGLFLLGYGLFKRLRRA